jgi:hypothetical protein
MHCPDKSDEVECNIVNIEDSYMKNIPPSPTVQDDKLRVFIAVNLFAILGISEVGNSISLQFEVELTWNDQRLTMTNLKRDKFCNTLNPEIIKQIWIPELVFYNTKDKLETLADEQAQVIITRNGSFEISSKSDLQNTCIFKGSENPITVSRTYAIEFICEFDMGVYPFDTQKCSIILILKGNSVKFVQMMLDEVAYTGPENVDQYFVKYTKITNYEVPSNTPAVKVDIVFGRRILVPMFNTYLPTFLICLVAFSTNYFKSFFFEALVTVNLTSLLVLTTIFIGISNSLPKTSYIKMIDIWLIFNLFIPFCEVILHTFIDSLRSDYGLTITGPSEKKDGSSTEVRVD